MDGISNGYEVAEHIFKKIQGKYMNVFNIEKCEIRLKHKPRGKF